MPRWSVHSSVFSVLLVAFFALPTLATTASNWTNPNARLPSFSSTYLVGERIYLSWQPLNQSLSDLWLTRYITPSNFTLRIASSLDISQAGSFPWTIAVSEEEVRKDTRFTFVFVPAGNGYEASTPADLDSPAFNLMMVNQDTPPNGTVGGSTTSTASSTASSTNTSSKTPSSIASSTSNLDTDKGSGLDYAQMGGIAAGILVMVALIGILMGCFVYKKRQARHDKKVLAHSDLPVSGPYEVLSDTQRPVEMNSKETQVHEMKGSRSSITLESDSASVYEVGNTVKRPGLHEMPG